MPNVSRRTGVLLVNLGTPDQPTPGAVRRYLAEFLSDPRVVEIPRFVWWPILYGVVLNVRPRKSAHAYQSIWLEHGSPLLVNTERLTQSVGETMTSMFGEEVVVATAMRYGNPSITDRLQGFRDQSVDRLVVLPLYPQYSAATTASTFDEITRVLGSWRRIPELVFLGDYHDHPGYIRAIAGSIADHWKTHGRGDALVLSFHGLPERSRGLGDPYYDQCVNSAALIAKELDLAEGQWRLVFQSRFGAAEWLKPYCVDVLRELPGQGIKAIDIVCPGFAADCLETLEEIAIANKEIFVEAGGESYRYIPALNAASSHVDLVTQLILSRLGRS